jgi:hypothetical protein
MNLDRVEYSLHGLAAASQEASAKPLARLWHKPARPEKVNKSMKVVAAKQDRFCHFADFEGWMCYCPRVQNMRSDGQSFDQELGRKSGALFAGGWRALGHPEG